MHSKFKNKTVMNYYQYRWCMSKLGAWYHISVEIQGFRKKKINHVILIILYGRILWLILELMKIYRNMELTRPFFFL
jgi:hypothetical protein